MKISIQDENFAGNVLNKIQIEMEKDSCTVRELIEKRISSEVSRYNNSGNVDFTGLVQPPEEDNESVEVKHQIDISQQIYIAINAFKNNSYFLLINGKQANDLDTTITIPDTQKVRFIKLMPLVGG